MNKKIMVVISTVLVAIVASNTSTVYGASMYWVGGTTDWSTQANWGGSPALPTYSDWVDIRHDAWVANYPVIGTGDTARAGSIRMNPGYGVARKVTLTVEGTGNLQLNDNLYIGNVGGEADVTMNGGSVVVGLAAGANYTCVGGSVAGSYGQLFMNGGTFDAATLSIPQSWSQTAPVPGGKVWIAGGELITRNIVFTDGVAGTIDITNGALVISGDARTDVNNYIISTRLTAYGSNDRGGFIIIYNGQNTRVTAQPTKLAGNPNPADMAEYVSPTTMLTWQAPTGVSNPTYNVYLSTDSNNLVLKSQGQTATSYDPNLDFATHYYWRIDVNDPNGGNPMIHTGSLWTFSTSGRAYNPNPAFKETVVANNVLTQDTVNSVTLSWEAFSNVISHEVYFDTDFDVVNNTDRFDSTGVYKGSQGVEDTNYGPIATQPDTTYYWRVDEVNNPTRLKGDIWSFSVPYYFYSGDDFEVYYSTSDLKATWIDGTDVNNPTGSVIELKTDNTQPVVHGGLKSVKFAYNNSGSTGKAYYSEIKGKCIVKDWTKNNIKALTLFFYGQAGNSHEQLYVTLKDGAGVSYTAGYPDLNDLMAPQWHVWNIAIQDFNNGGVNITDVNFMYIGFGNRNTPVIGGLGTVYFDDIRLHKSRCLGSGPATDLNGDCTVNLNDLEIYADNWLGTSALKGDFNSDLNVDFKDFAALASEWLETKIFP